MNLKLKQFLEQISTPTTQSVMESIFEGYSIIFESTENKLFTGMTTSQYNTLKENGFQPKEYLLLYKDQQMAQQQAAQYAKSNEGEPVVFSIDADKIGNKIRLARAGTAFKGIGKFNELLEPIEGQSDTSTPTTDQSTTEPIKSSSKDNIIKKGLKAASQLDKTKTGQKEVANIAQGALDIASGVKGIFKGKKSTEDEEEPESESK